MPRTDQGLAYETALRALDQQERTFDALRTRAGTVLAAGSLAISLFASDGRGPDGPAVLNLAILAAYLLCSTASLRVLLPRVDGAFSCAPATVASWERLHRPADVESQIVRELTRCYAANGATVRVLDTRCRVAAIALAIETFLLVIRLATNIV